MLYKVGLFSIEYPSSKNFAVSPLIPLALRYSIVSFPGFDFNCSLKTSVALVLILIASDRSTDFSCLGTSMPT